MASVYVRLGTDVTVIEFMDKLCPFLDDDISKAFLRSLQKQGIKFMLGHKVTSATNLGNSA